MHTKLEALLKKYDAILLTSPYNMRYFGNFSCGEGAVWITGSRKAVITDSRYIEQASAEAGLFEIRESGNWIDEVCSYIDAEQIKNILFEDAFMSAAVYMKLSDKAKSSRLCVGSKMLNDLRMVKTAQELDIMAQAELICCRAFEKIIDFIKPGISEKELAAELEYYIRKCGGEGVAFETIVVSGARSSLPHGTPSDKIIEKNDFVTLDFGCVYKGYCSDMTRTVVVGKATEKQKEIYSIVKEAQQIGLEAITSGVTGRNADFAARSVIEKCGYGEYFRHSLGHGVGLCIHEMPNLSPKSEVVLEENMVVTCEPGIYIPDFGGVRIEDMVCVKTDKVLNMTPATKELLEL